ncbi:apoptosis-inducing factor 2 [Ceratobasidium sp. AG-Ba]|nr:apoptosis-inducing factor 2 [Ceratobasidium sp. AG-Ba]
MAHKKNIVVVGFGGGGFSLVKALRKGLDTSTHQIVIIEQRDYYPHWPALIRPAVTAEGSIEEQALIRFDRVLGPDIRLVHSAAKEINSNVVVTESGESVPYEHLVLATGSSWNDALNLPNSRSEAIEHFKSYRKKVSAADHILIIGGGAVGLEYAGELRHYTPEKEVTLVHAQKELMNQTYPSKYRKSLLDGITKLGVKVILGDRISTNVVPENGYVTTEGGERIRADMIIVAIGGKPNTEVVRTLDPGALTQSGTVVVTPELRVKLASGAQNVWAIGDIIEWPEQKMVFKASTGHAPIVAANILAAIKGGKPTPYGGKFEAIVVTLGPKGGRGVLPLGSGIVIGDWISSKLKSDGLFIQPVREIFGYKEPKSSSSTVTLALGALAIPIAYVLYNRYVN